MITYVKFKYYALEKLMYMSPFDVKGLSEDLLITPMEAGRDIISMLGIDHIRDDEGWGW